MEDILERWKGDEGSRARWHDFMLTPEFERGMRVLEAHAVPIVVMGEDLEQTAKRQSFQAGFHAALRLVRRIPTVHYKKVQEQMPEWDHIEPVELHE